MGFLRLILALNVVIAHAGSLFNLVSVGGVIAVQVFFIISGFYMSLILSEKYNKPNSYRLFISNRFLRLFPVYYIVLFLTISVSFFIPNLIGNSDGMAFWKENFANLSFSSVVILVLSLIALLGQEFFCFLKLDSGNLLFTTSFLQSEQSLQPYRFLFVPQAWTLSLELMFYFIAPFVVKKSTRIILAIMAISFLARVLLYQYGFNHDPWNYRFFPLEILFFFAGIISYRIYRKVKHLKISAKISIALIFLLFAYIILFQYIPVYYELKQWFLYLAIVVLIPFLFIITKDNNFDREVGELSYPVYITHVFSIGLLSQFYIDEKPKYFCFLAIIFSILVSILIIKFIINPIEKFRQERIRLNSTNQI